MMAIIEFIAHGKREGETSPPIFVPLVTYRRLGTMGKWYEDPRSTVYTAVYCNDKEMQREVLQASRCGWQVKQMTGIPGHTNVGMVVASIGLFGRTKDKIIVHYERDEAWLKAKHEELARRKAALAKRPWWIRMWLPPVEWRDVIQ